MIIEIANERNNKFAVIKGVKCSIDIRLPTKILDWKFWLGKNNNPENNPINIVLEANFVLIFLLKKP